VQVQQGYRIEKVVGGLSFPTSLAWDEAGKMYVVEAGGGFLPEPSPARILRVESGKTTEVANLTAKGVVAPS
jgi:FtsP/CotA-like multicopper oxidase with cupredoxin domain